jgi:teichuronic acid biosynthesis glycosyltransferase TuaG
MIKYSVIIPYYNNRLTIVEAVNSVANQILPSNVCLNKVIIVDDGSLEALESDVFPQPLRDTICIVRQVNSGVASARNFGLSQIDDEDFIAFLDADDAWHPEKCLLSIDYLLEGEYGMVGTFSNSHYFGLKEHELGSIFPVDYRKQLFRNYFLTSSVMLNLNIVSRSDVYFPTGQRHAEEGDLFFRLAKKYKAGVVCAELVNYSSGKSPFGDSGLSSNYMAMQLGELKNGLRFLRRRDIGILMFLVFLSVSILKFFRRTIIGLFRK